MSPSNRRMEDWTSPHQSQRRPLGDRRHRRRGNRSTAASRLRRPTTFGPTTDPTGRRPRTPRAHSRPPTRCDQSSLARAAALAAAPMGGYAVPANCSRSNSSSDFTAPEALEIRLTFSEGQRQLRPTAEIVAESRRRRSSCQGVGQRSMQAATQNAAANSQPIKRGPTSPAGWATATGNTKSRRAAVEAVATWGDSMPAKRTANPTTAIDGDRRHLVGRDHRAQSNETAPSEGKGHIRDEAGAGPTREVHQEQQGERTKRSEETDLRVGEQRHGSGRRQWA